MKIQAAILFALMGLAFYGGRYSAPPAIQINHDGTLTVDGIHLNDGENLDVNPDTGAKTVVKTHHCYNNSQSI